MRYFASPAREAMEERLLPLKWNKQYAPSGSVTLRSTAALATPGVELLELDGETLAIAPETATWAFLSQREKKLFQDLGNRSFGWLEDNLGKKESSEFASALFRRGLMTIDGVAAMDDRMFADGGNYDEGHLVELLITEKCNLNCGYCLAGANPSMPAMNKEIATRAVDLAFAMKEARSYGFEFSGGEPFMKYGLMCELVDYIREHPQRAGRPVSLMIQTNGTLLTPERVAWVRENDIRIGLSLDGHPQLQNVSRPMLNGSGSFARLIDGIDLLQRAGVPFGALVVLNRANAGSAEELIDFLLDNGITGFKLNPVAFIGAARANWDTVGLTDNEVIRYFQTLLGTIAVNGYSLVESNAFGMLEFLTSKQRPTRCLRSDCGAGDTFQAVAASGDIYPCGRATQTPALRMGNVLDVTLESLSKPALSHELVSAIRTRRPDSIEECVTCAYRQLCQAGCSAQAYERYRTVRHRTPECSYFKTMYPYLMRWLSFDEASFASLNRSGYFGEGAYLVTEQTPERLSTAVGA